MRFAALTFVVGLVALRCSVAWAGRPDWKEFWCEAIPEKGARIPWGWGPLKNGNVGRWVKTYPPHQTADVAKQRFADEIRVRGVDFVAGSIRCDEDPLKVYP